MGGGKELLGIRFSKPGFLETEKPGKVGVQLRTGAKGCDGKVESVPEGLVARGLQFLLGLAVVFAEEVGDRDIISLTFAVPAQGLEQQGGEQQRVSDRFFLVSLVAGLSIES